MLNQVEVGEALLVQRHHLPVQHKLSFSRGAKLTPDVGLVASVVVAVTGPQSDLAQAYESQHPEPVQLGFKEPPGVGEGLVDKADQHGL